MIYSDLVRKAANILFDAHKDDMDKGGYPYVFHPFFLAVQMYDEASVCVAMLHDVLEDHSDRYSIDSLRAEGFPDDILAALQLLTHTKGMPYMDYVRRITTNPIATQVKIADLRHNLDSSRNGYKQPPKAELYKEALLLLTSVR